MTPTTGFREYSSRHCSGTTDVLKPTDLALDQGCRMPEPALLALTQDAVAVPAMLPSNRHKLLMYVGHLRHAQGDSAGVIGALDDAFSAFPVNPLPLILAATWRLDAGEVDMARALYDGARAIGAPGRLDLEPRFQEVAGRLSEARGRSGDTGRC